MFLFHNHNTTVVQSYYDPGILLQCTKYAGIIQVLRTCMQAYERKHYDN